MKKLVFCILFIILISSPALAAAPTITTYLNRCIALEGTTALFSITATGTVPLTYQWQKSSDGGNTWIDISGENTPDYSFTAYTSDDGTRFRVNVSNSYGSITSNAVTLTVIVADTPPRIIVDLAPWYPVVEGTVVEFSIMAVTGAAPLTYQWQRSNNIGATWNDINGASAADYSFIARASDEYAMFRVIISNSYGSVTSNITYLVLQLIQPEFRIDTQPVENTTVTEGSITGNLFVEASVSPFGRLYYQWYYNTTNNNTGGMYIPGATSASFSIPTILTASGSPYYFYCEVFAERDPEIDPAILIEPQYLLFSSELPPAPKCSDVAKVTVNTAFVPVTSITGVPTLATAGTPLSLTATVNPSNATNQTITWSIYNSGGTDASVSDSTLSTTAVGVVIVRATIVNGLRETTDYTQNFNITVKVDLDNNITIGGEQFVLGENISGFDWKWNAVNRILTLSGENMDAINITTSSDVRIVVKGNTTLPRIVKTGAGSLTITVESGKTLTINSTYGPAINASGDIVLAGDGTIHAFTKDQSASTVMSYNGSLFITTRIVKVTAYGNDYALYAKKIAITSGTTELNAKDDDHAFNVEPEYSGSNTKVIAPSGKVFYNGNGDDIGIGGSSGGCNSIMAYSGMFGFLIVLSAVYCRGLRGRNKRKY